MTKNELLDNIKNCITVEENRIFVNKDITEEQLLEVLKQVFDFEKEQENVDILLSLKGLESNKIAQAVKYALTRDDLKDPLMLLNILNLVKIYNTLDDSFFENKDIYVSSIEDLLDVKLAIRSELKAFIRQMSIYFISLFKSYNKVDYTPTDTHIKLPLTYSNLFLASDIMTLSGIFSVSDTFETSECVYIEEAFKYISTLLIKNSLSIAMMNTFLEGIDNGNSNK